MKKAIVILIVLAVLGGGAAFYWCVYLPGVKAAMPAVVTAKVERGDIRLIVASPGRVVSNLDIEIKCKASGEIVELPCDVSDVVKKEALLVRLDTIDEDRVLKRAEVDLAASQAKLEIARQNLVVAERTLATDKSRAEAALKAAEVHAKDTRAKADRMKQLLEKGLSSPEETDTAETAAVQAVADHETARVRMDELKTQELALELKRQDVKLAEVQVAGDEVSRDIAKDRLRDTKVVAPMDGIVSARNVQIGQIISSAVSVVGGGTTVLTLSDLSRIFVLASVDESFIGKVQLGQEADIMADAYAGKRFKGKVVRIATKGVCQSNVVTFEVKMEVIGDDKNLLKPEMTTNVEITAAAKSGVLLVPAEAVVRKPGGKYVVTVVKDEGTNEEVPVEAGISDWTKTEVVSGLTEGQTVQVKQRPVVDPNRRGPPPPQ